MLLNISHKTHYTFQEPAGYGLQQLRVTPKTRDNQKVIKWEVNLDGATKQADFEDQNNNTVILASIDEGVSEVIVESVGSVETKDTSGVLGQHGGFAPLWYFRRATPMTTIGKRVRHLASELGGEHDSELAKIHALSKIISEKIVYETGMTDARTTAEEALETGHGVCQDHTHVLIAAARHMGYPARYVGGYLMMNDRVEQEAGHAWAEVHLDQLGWVGFDASNGISPDDRYVRVATGLDYLAAAPVSGIRIGSAASQLNDTMLVNVQVQQ